MEVLDANAAPAPAPAPILAVSEAASSSTSASSVTASTIEAQALTVDTSFATTSSESFIEKGGTLKRNVHATKNEVWACFQVYKEKKFHTHAFC